MMKYAKEDYENLELFSPCEGEFSHSQKIVKCRIPHSCALCSTTIQKGEYALYEKAVITGQGWGNCWSCIPCCEDWMKATRYSVTQS